MNSVWFNSEIQQQLIMTEWIMKSELIDSGKQEKNERIIYEVNWMSDQWICWMNDTGNNN